MISQVLGLVASADCIFMRPEVVYDKYVFSQHGISERLLME